MTKKSKVAVIAVIILLTSFYAGFKIGGNSGPQNSWQNQAPGSQQRTNRPGERGNAEGSIMAFGEILSKDDKSITVKLRDGGSKIVFFSDSTEVTKSVQGALVDLVVGEQVSATGTSNSDGSIASKTIQILPANLMQKPQANKTTGADVSLQGQTPIKSN
ncbi:MAG: hypothetical protein WCX95_05245 [Candidatus Gracilibacteria bacterium]